MPIGPDGHYRMRRCPLTGSEKALEKKRELVEAQTQRMRALAKKAGYRG